MSDDEPGERRDALYAALGRLPSGLYIMTTGDGASGAGMLASWVQQASFEPPMVSVAMKRGRPILEQLADGAPFVLNLLAAGQKKLLGHFGKGFEPGEPAFEGVDVTPTASGPAALAEALAYLECRAESVTEAGDHALILAEVVAGEVLGDGEPMVHVRKRGDHY